MGVNVTLQPLVNTNGAVICWFTAPREWVKHVHDSVLSRSAGTVEEEAPMSSVAVVEWHEGTSGEAMFASTSRTRVGLLQEGIEGLLNPGYSEDALEKWKRSGDSWEATVLELIPLPGGDRKCIHCALTSVECSARACRRAAKRTLWIRMGVEQTQRVQVTWRDGSPEVRRACCRVYPCMCSRQVREARIKSESVVRNMYREDCILGWLLQCKESEE